MKKLLLLTFIITAPTLAFSKELISVACTSFGSGSSQIVISLSADFFPGLNTGSGILSSRGFMQLNFNVFAEDKTTGGNTVISLVGEEIEAELSLETELVDTATGEIAIPAGSGKLTLTKKPEVGATVYNEYTLSGCVGMM